MFCNCKQRILKMEEELAEFKKTTVAPKLWEVREEVMRSLFKEQYGLSFFQRIADELNKLQLNP